MPRPNYFLGRGSTRTGSGLWSAASRSSGQETVYTGTLKEKLAQYRAEHPDVGLESGSSAELTKTIARFLNSPDKEIQKVGQDMLNGDINTETAQALGIETTAAAQQEKKKESKSFMEKVGEKVSPVLDFINRPAQAVEELVQAASYDLGLEDHFSPDATKLNDPGNLTEAGQRVIGEAAGSGGYRDALRALKGEARWDPTSQTYTKNLTLAGALGQDPQQLGSDWMSRVVNTADFVGTAALDPLNFAGGGTKAAARGVEEVAARKLAEEGAESLTPALTRQLARQGSAEATEDALRYALQKTGVRKGLSKAQQETVLQALIEEGAAGRTTRGLFSKTPRTVELRGDSWRNPFERLVRTGRGLRSGEVRAAENRLNAALRYDRGGLRFANASLPQEVTAPVRDFLLGREQLLGRANQAAAVVSDFDALQATLSQKVAENTEKADEIESAVASLRNVTGDTEELAKSEQLAKRFRTNAANLQSRLDATEGLTTAEEMIAAFPELGSATAPLRREGNRRLPSADWFGNTFSPRAGIRRSLSLPGGTDEAVYAAESLGRSFSSQEQRQFGRTLEKAAKDAGTLDDETRMAMLAALDEGGDVAALAATLPEAQANYLRTLDELRKRTYNTNVEHGLASAERLRDPDNYMARIFTDEGRAAIAKAVDRQDPVFTPWIKASSAARETGQGGHLLARKLDPDLPILEFNQKWTDLLEREGYLKPGQKLMETDPAVIIAKRQNETAYALQKVKAIDEMTKIKGALGESMVWREKPGAKSLASAARKRGLQAVDLGEAGTVYAHPDIAKELTNYFAVSFTDEGARDIAKFLDKWNRLWKSYATVPILTGTGFHVKNGIGNVFNNYLAGVSLASYGEALSLQRDISAARKAHPELSIPEALVAAGKTDQQIARVELALENGVIDEGFFSVDLADNPTIDVSRTRGLGGKVNEKINPKQIWNNPSNALGVQTGRKIGEAVEDNARMAHFLSKLDETGDATQAAHSVKRYLFDYGDLTKTEQNVAKRIHAFYTFTRKNTPLQFAELIRNPAAVRRAMMFEDFALGSDENNTAAIPEFMAERGRPLGKTQSGFLTGGTGNPVIGNVETPLEAALKTADPLRSLIPGYSGPSAQESSQNALGNVSGGPAELVKAAAEEAGGGSLFTGSSLTNPDGSRKINPLVRISQAFAPNISKGLRIAGSDLAGRQADSPELRLIKAMTGLQAGEVTPEASERELSSREQALAELADALNARGKDVPTLEELMAVGAFPEPEVQEPSPETQIREIMLSGNSEATKRRQLKKLLGELEKEGYVVPSVSSLLAN